MTNRSFPFWQKVARPQQVRIDTNLYNSVLSCRDIITSWNSSSIHRPRASASNPSEPSSEMDGTIANTTCSCIPIRYGENPLRFLGRLLMTSTRWPTYRNGKAKAAVCVEIGSLYHRLPTKFMVLGALGFTVVYATAPPLHEAGRS